jgi:DNA-binding HxlR family transcriptional regulator
MKAATKEVDCPAEITLAIIAGRWKLLILRQLLAGITRSGELRRSLKGISQKVLTQHLRELEKAGVVRRTVYAEVPPKVEYCLTPSGKTLKPVLDALHAWGLEHTRTHGRMADDGRKALDE